MGIAMTAQLRDLAAFEAEFTPGMENDLDQGAPLVLYAAANTSPVDRLGILGFLLDRGARVDGRGDRGAGVFHVLFGATKRDALPDTVPVVERLLAAGADPNALDDAERDALFELIRLGATDELLAPLYDVWFAQDLRNIEHPANDGYTPLAAARLLPYRGDLVRRMEEKAGV